MTALSGAAAAIVLAGLLAGFEIIFGEGSLAMPAGGKGIRTDLLSTKEQVMGDRSGVGLVELAVLETLEALTAGRPRVYATSAEVVSGVEERIGLRPPVRL